MSFYKNVNSQQHSYSRAMRPRIASPQLPFFLQARSLDEPKPIVVGSDIFVSELFTILHRIQTSNYLLEVEQRSGSINVLEKKYEIEKTQLLSSQETQELLTIPTFVVVINGFNLLGILTEQELIELSNPQKALEEIKLFEVVQPTSPTYLNIQIRLFLKTFSLFQQYWIRRLPVVNRQGQVIGTVNPEKMHSMVEAYMQRKFTTLLSEQNLNPNYDLLNSKRAIASNLIETQSTEVEVMPLELDSGLLDNQTSDLRLLEAKLAQKTAEAQYINRQLQSQIDENLQLKQQLERYQKTEQTTAHLAQWSSSPLSLKPFLENAVTQVQELFQFDRVCIYQYESNWSGLVVAEAVKKDFSSLLNFLIHQDVISSEQWLDRYQRGEVCCLENVNHQTMDADYPLDEETLTLMRFFQVESQLIVPIQVNGILWGLLVVQQCAESYHWQASEISLLRIVASSLKAAIEQSGLSNQVQSLHKELSLQEKNHINRLQQALDFEAMLNRVTDRVRDSLDEEQILQTAIQELVTVLGVRCCQVVLGDSPSKKTSDPSPNYSTDPGISVDEGNMITEHEDLSQQTQRGQCCQICLTDPLLNQGKNSILVCPIFDDQGYLGDLRLYSRRHSVFYEQEIGLVQQVASHCAIAIRQARLYQAAQAQVQELEHLHQLKDDFLSTVSHELRTPLSSIKMVTNLLKMTLSKADPLFEEAIHHAVTAKISHYLRVLEEECDREINLINDLLATQNLNTGIHPLSLTTIHLQDWVNPIFESFQHRARIQQQQLDLIVPDNLPAVVSDSFMLSRILVELLNNACKYTPSGHPIALELALHAQSFQIRVKNAGIEIPSDALPRIFDPFYRIPQSDRWKNGGTGLGLSLIKRFVEYLGGKIWVESEAETVQFFVELPLSPPVMEE